MSLRGGFTDEQRKYIRDEIHAALLAMKKQMDKEITEDKAELESKIKKASDAGALVPTGQNMQLQIATLRKETNALVAAAAQQVSQKVYTKVMDEINTKVIPKVDNAIAAVAYMSQDGDEINNAYRRAVHKQSSEEDGLMRLTDGKKPTHKVNNQMDRFFTDDD